MLRLLCPHQRVNSLSEIDFSNLKALGITGLIFDLDNTLIPWGSPTMCPKAASWLQELKTAGFKLCLVSNNRHQRVQDIAGALDVPFVSRALKPAKTGFRRALNEMGLQPSEAAVIGDQIFTDVLGGNRLGLYTIWVKPLDSREFPGTKITRRLEALTVMLLKAKGMLK